MLDHADFDLPMTEEFVARVHRGVRRRRLLRMAAASCAVLALAGAATLVIRSAYGPEPAPPVTPPVVSAPAVRLLEGFRIDYVPDGMKPDEQDSSAVYAVSRNRLHNDDSTPPDRAPNATVGIRLYLRDDGAMLMAISVLRPLLTTPEADEQQVFEWLRARAVNGWQVLRTYDLPAGRAQLLTFQGSEGPQHQIVITTPDLAVIEVSGNGVVPVAELERVAGSIRHE